MPTPLHDQVGATAIVTSASLCHFQVQLLMEGRKPEAARMEAGEEKAAKQQPLAKSGKNRMPGRRRWRSSSVDLDVETPAMPTGAAAAMLSRSYSTTAAVGAAAVVDGGGARQKQQQLARVVVGEVGREHKRLGAGARLSRKIKEQRARFYIFRRCVSMLICWHEDPDE